MRILDLFCGAGGCAVGYHRAGFDVVGVDNRPQPRYPFEFIQADALKYLAGDLSGFDAIHASPPCQAFSDGSRNWNGRPGSHPDLIVPTRSLCLASGLRYVIENVPGSPLESPLLLCGSMFGLRVRRHRLFETNWTVMAPPCAHGWQRSNTHRMRSGYEPRTDSIVPVYGGGQAGFSVALCREAMGIDWMTTAELNQAIPPAYTELIGHQLAQHIRQAAA